VAYNTTRSLEQRYKSGVAGLYAQLKSNYGWICERFGEEEGVKVITDMSRRYGLQVVERLAPNLTYRIGKSIPAGDSYCEHIIEVKTPP